MAYSSWGSPICYCAPGVFPPHRALVGSQGRARRRAVPFLDRLGIVPSPFFALLSPLIASLEGWMRFHDFIPPQLEDAFPSLETRPLIAFFVYLVILDFFEYWRHRLSHTFRWWWALHVIHHSQRQMSLWTDSRNHLLDDLIGGAWFALIALFIGVPRGISSASWWRSASSRTSPTSTPLSFGWLGERLLVSPRYHRWHHAVDLPEGRQFRHGCNFAILFPIWDRLFGTQHMVPACRPPASTRRLSRHPNMPITSGSSRRTGSPAWLQRSRRRCSPSGAETQRSSSTPSASRSPAETPRADQCGGGDDEDQSRHRIVEYWMDGWPRSRRC